MMTGRAGMSGEDKKRAIVLRAFLVDAAPLLAYHLGLTPGLGVDTREPTMSKVLPLFAGLLLAAIAGCGPTLSPEDKAASTLERSGAIVERDENDPAHPVVRVGWFQVRVWMGTRWVTDDDLNELAALQNLKQLDISGSYVTDKGLRNELAKLKTLKSLNLVGCTKVTEAGVAALKKDLPGCDISGPRVNPFVFWPGRDVGKPAPLGPR
jgi:hypothetical protein